MRFLSQKWLSGRRAGPRLGTALIFPDYRSSDFLLRMGSPLPPYLATIIYPHPQPNPPVPPPSLHGGKCNCKSDLSYCTTDHIFLFGLMKNAAQELSLSLAFLCRWRMACLSLLTGLNALLCCKLSLLSSECKNSRKHNRCFSLVSNLGVWYVCLNYQSFPLTNEVQGIST